MLGNTDALVDYQLHAPANQPQVVTSHTSHQQKLETSPRLAAEYPSPPGHKMMAAQSKLLFQLNKYCNERVNSRKASVSKIIREVNGFLIYDLILFYVDQNYNYYILWLLKHFNQRSISLSIRGISLTFLID